MDAKDLIRIFSLALCIWRESRGESLLGKLLVGQTVENRVRDPRWPDTYISVITQKFQFSAFNQNDPNVVTYPKEDDLMWPDCVAVAEFIISAPGKITMANHYHAKSITPSWAKDKVPLKIEGNHIFYEL